MTLPEDGVDFLEKSLGNWNWRHEFIKKFGTNHKRRVYEKV